MMNCWKWNQETDELAQCEAEQMEWARVDETVIGEVRISTVFLSIDHNFGDGQPVLFETMIFEGEHDGYQMRYRTAAEARIGHTLAVKLVLGEPVEREGEFR